MPGLRAQNGERLSQQPGTGTPLRTAHRAAQSHFAPILLLEGDPLRVDHSLMRPENIRGALTYITAILRVPVLPSSGPAESAHLVYAAARQCQVGHAAHGPAGGRR